jgi:hypothetical protein
VAILNLERWIVAVGRAIEHHHQMVGAEADVAPELLEIDRRLWLAPQDIGDRFRVDIAGRREAAR